MLHLHKKVSGDITMIRDLVIYLKWQWECWKQRKLLKVVRKQQDLLRRARKGANHGRKRPR